MRNPHDGGLSGTAINAGATIVYLPNCDPQQDRENLAALRRFAQANRAHNPIEQDWLNSHNARLAQYAREGRLVLAGRVDA